MDDEWGLTVEELDSLETNAKRQLAERRRSPSTASAPPAAPSSAFTGHHPQKFYSSPPKNVSQSPSKYLGRSQALAVKFFRDEPGRIAVQTQFNQHLLAALKAVVGHEWDANRRVWTYPETRFEELATKIMSIPQLVINIEAVPPLSLPTHVMQDGGCSSGLNLHPQGSPRKFPHRSLALDYQEQLKEENPLSPSRLKVCTGLPQISPMKVPSTSLVVQIYMMGPDSVAARSPYNEKIKEACQSVAGRSWNVEDRVWTFPVSKMEELVRVLLSIASPQVTVEAVPPLKISITPSTSTFANQLELCEPNFEPSQTPPQSTPQSVNVPKHSVKLSLHSSGLIAAKCEYNTRLVATLRSIPKADWNPKERLWLFPVSSLEEAEKSLSSISDLLVTVLSGKGWLGMAELFKIETLEPLVRRAIEASASASNLQGKYSTIPSELESQLLPFQRDGVKFALQRGGRVLIGDEMGLGKSLQAIAVVSSLRDEWPVLIVVPSSLRLQWATTLTQWLKICPKDITVVLSQSSASNIEGFTIVQSAGKQAVQLYGLFNIVSYDLIIIADEAHYLKNAQAKRTNACVPLLQRAKYALLLTGTPALSRPIELFKQLEALQPGVYKSVKEYGNRYCMGGNFGQYQGATNREELHALVKATVMIRRLKKDVLSQLPQKRRQQVFVALDDKGTKQMRALFYELEAIKRNIKGSSQDDFDKLKYAEKQLVNKIYTESAIAKLPAVQDYLMTILEADCKFLIFAHHQSMLDGIQSVLMKKKVGYIRIDGATPQGARQALVTRFQENDSIRAAVLGIRAAGVGLTLTAASTVIFAEMSWTPGDLVQAEDRAHRIGQESSVNVYYLHAHETIDDIIWDTVQNKLESLSQVLDGREDVLHVAAAPHHLLPQGQSTLDSFLRTGPLESLEDDAPQPHLHMPQVHSTLDSFPLESQEDYRGLEHCSQWGAMPTAMPGQPALLSGYGPTSGGYSSCAATRHLPEELVQSGATDEELECLQLATLGKRYSSEAGSAGTGSSSQGKRKKLWGI